MRIKTLLPMALAALVVLAGCSGPANEPASSTQEALTPTTGDAETAEPPTEAADTRIPSPVNGLLIPPERAALRPIAVMLDNHVKARPQAGLSEADVVVEAMAEGQLTRYLAIFQSKDPETLGPVRSARPYFVDRALEYDPYYVHAGGSMAALTDVVKLKVADVDALHEGKVTFWRKSHKKAPHNLYTSPEAVRNAAAARGYGAVWAATSPGFGVTAALETGQAFQDAVLRFKDPGKGDSTGYTVQWHIGAAGRLERSVNGAPHVDETTALRLEADTVIVQFIHYRTLDSEGRLGADHIGTGEGLLLHGGKSVAITWKKTDRKARTEYSDAAGNPITIPAGVLWIEMFPANRPYEIK